MQVLRADLNGLSQDERLAVLLNLYHIMVRKPFCRTAYWGELSVVCSFQVILDVLFIREGGDSWGKKTRGHGHTACWGLHCVVVFILSHF
jgi:hypothetical protein